MLRYYQSTTHPGDLVEKIRGQVKFHPYESMVVGDRYLTVPRGLLDDFENALAEKAGVKMTDNKTVYEIAGNQFGESQEVVYVQFHDMHAHFGRSISPRRG